MAAEDDPAGGGSTTPWRTAKGVLLLVPVAAAAATVAVPPDRPRLFGIPLFYLLHFAICLLSVALAALFRHLTRTCDGRRRRAAER
ncbi:DUF3311 domain-containing protein [Streptomyces hundungensis]|uniref:DUF3311 domain-containing protein n=1 Tax=Streptomyces hundungensis TaxID=1077946 RepID=UPI0033DD4C5F